ncbi:hypothetical protein NDU88_000783 [Pleurodeles waltl]|uniref:Uncharacterized protein n=1 Tax=Pleurodeles waltl TaxID=8319 RepID=A0AAV7MJ27_PLEWA|nr:hypothetical protein NDU88_000783 [Pleurodeles waltl]
MPSDGPVLGLVRCQPSSQLVALLDVHGECHSLPPRGRGASLTPTERAEVEAKLKNNKVFIFLEKAKVCPMNSPEVPRAIPARKTSGVLRPPRWASKVASGECAREALLPGEARPPGKRPETSCATLGPRRGRAGRGGPCQREEVLDADLRASAWKQALVRRLSGVRKAKAGTILGRQASVRATFGEKIAAQERLPALHASHNNAQGQRLRRGRQENTDRGQKIDLEDKYVEKSHEEDERNTPGVFFRVGKQ